MKKIFKVLVFILLASFSFSCDHQSLENSEIIESSEQKELAVLDSQNPFGVTTVSFSDIPEIVDEIAENVDIEKLSWSYLEKGGRKFWLKRKNIVKVKNDKGDVTYSIRIKTNESEPTSIYNLIVVEKRKGKKMKPFVMEFEFENHLRYLLYVQDQSKDKRFEGVIHRYGLKQFAQQTDFLSKSGSCGSTNTGGATNSNGESTNNTSESAGNTGGGDSGWTSGGSNWSSGGNSWSSGGESSSGGGGGGGYVEVGEGKFGSVINSEKSFVEGKSDDCPQGEMTIGVNAIPEWLCGDYKFQAIGDAYVANVGGLGFMAARFNTGNGDVELFQVSVPNICFQIPKRYANQRGLSQALTSSYNSALIELFALANLVPDGIELNHYWYEKNLTDLITANLNAEYFDMWINTQDAQYGGVAVASRATCYTTANNYAQWCP